MFDIFKENYREAEIWKLKIQRYTEMNVLSFVR